jgi:formylmethanofuran dehydrogenase subunit A
MPASDHPDRRHADAMLRIRGGRVFDPPSGRRGESGDVCMRGGRIVDSLPAAAATLDARHLVVMAGAVEVHTHVAGPAVGAARLLCPEDDGRCLPVFSEVGRQYARLGYTTVMEAAVAPLGALAAHTDLDAVPIVDKGIFVLLGDDAIALDFIRQGCLDRLKPSTRASTSTPSICKSSARCSTAASRCRPAGSRSTCAGWRSRSSRPA